MGSDLSQWFDHQLRSTLDGFIWAIHQLSRERWYTQPPSALGGWTAAQHVYHMLDYEKRLALPTMYLWLGKTPTIQREPDHKVEDDQTPIEEMLTKFEQVRQEEIGLLSKYDQTDWETVLDTTVWGEVSLYWLVCKTYQHTNEHVHDILRFTLFWDRIIARTARGQ